MLVRVFVPCDFRDVCVCVCVCAGPVRDVCVRVCVFVLRDVRVQAQHLRARLRPSVQRALEYFSTAVDFEHWLDEGLETPLNLLPTKPSAFDVAGYYAKSRAGADAGAEAVRALVNVDVSVLF